MPVSDDVLRRQLDHCLSQTNLPFGVPRRGKVRDIYALEDDRVVLVTTDRISAFDHVLPQPIPFKGQVLNLIAAHFFSATADLVPNHVVSVPDPNVLVARRCEPLPVEFVVRGHLAGHAWRTYSAGRRSLCGVPMPDGLREGERLPTPVITPTTKAGTGHDEDITTEVIVERGLVDPDVLERATRYALRLFERGTDMAAQRGLILVDTKYEFGLASDGQLLLIDEVHTPDSSRYYVEDGFEERLATGERQEQLSKEFVREWLMERGFQGADGEHPPDLPDDFRIGTARRYIELFENVSGREFEPDTNPDPERRIAEAVAALV